MAKNKKKPTVPTLTVQLGEKKHPQVYSDITDRSKVLGVETTVYHREILKEEQKTGKVFNRLKKAFNS